MIWAAIGDKAKKSELVVILRNKTLLRNSYTSASYIEALKEGLLPIYNGETFMQDNALIHISGPTINWLAEISIYVLLNWLLYLFDLNCIEHIWYLLKDKLNKSAPHLEGITNKERQKEVILE